MTADNLHRQEKIMEDGLGDLLSNLSQSTKERVEKFTLEFDVKYPIEISGIKKHLFRGRSVGAKRGDFVAIRPCGDECQGKTYLGLYLGDFPVEYFCNIEKQTGILHIMPSGNPAIFVFDLNDIVWGRESWWGIIKDENHLREISDDDIQNIWYVKALKHIINREDSRQPPPDK